MRWISSSCSRFGSALMSALCCWTQGSRMLRRDCYSARNGEWPQFGKRCRTCSVTAEREFRDLVRVLALGIAAEQQLHPRDQRVLVEPHLRVIRIEADELQLGILLAAFEPRRDVPVPEPVDHRAVVALRELAFDEREQVMTLRGEMQRRATGLIQLAHEVGVLRREEPDGTARTLVVQDLRAHGLAVSALDADEPEHRHAIALQRPPEFVFDFRFRAHGVLLWWSRSFSQWTPAATRTAR